VTYLELMGRVLANPEADEPRRDFAAFIEAEDPAWSRFITLQLERTHLGRARRLGRLGTTAEEDHLEISNRARWEEPLSTYLGELGRHRLVEFCRGFPWKMTMNPYLFIEVGAYVLSRVAPLRGIDFYADPDGDPFPMTALARCPALAKLDYLGFASCGLTDSDLETLANSAHLGRCSSMVLTSRPEIPTLRNTFSHRGIEALAASSATRSCLTIDLRRVLPVEEGDPGEFSELDGDAGVNTWDLGEFGKQLERAYGYIPWLHLVNVCDPTDAHFWIEKKVLPRFKSGADVSSLTPHGTGLSRAGVHRLRARSERTDPGDIPWTRW
jgi:hypothetical protein